MNIGEIVLYSCLLIKENIKTKFVVSNLVLKDQNNHIDSIKIHLFCLLYLFKIQSGILELLFS